MLLQKVSNEKKRKELIVVTLEKAAKTGQKTIVELVLRLPEHSASLRGLLHNKESFIMHRKELLEKALDSAAQHDQKAIVEIVLKNWS